MQYSFPDEFPEKSRRALLAEEIRAARELEKVKTGAGVSGLQGLLIRFILRVFIVFAREASELVYQGIWNAGDLESASLQFLHDYTVNTRHERGYDKYGRDIGEMISHWGDILPHVERAFRRSPLWQEYEGLLLEVAQDMDGSATAGSQHLQSCLTGVRVKLPSRRFRSGLGAANSPEGVLRQSSVLLRNLASSMLGIIDEPHCLNTHGGRQTAQGRADREGETMKYLAAWLLGVPGVLVIGWFLLSHH
jgi:hypothetical protein